MQNSDENLTTPGSGRLRRSSNYSSGKKIGSNQRVRTPLASGGRSRPHPVTPHTLRALGKLANTPARRRSLRFGRGNRATPRDELRVLSRVLAKERREKQHQQQRQREEEEPQEKSRQQSHTEEEFARFEDVPEEAHPEPTYNEDDYDIVEPVEMDDLDLEVKRRAPDRLSVANGYARMSEGFDFGNASIISGNGRKSDTFAIEMDDDDDEGGMESSDIGRGAGENNSSNSDNRLLLQGDSFRIEFNEEEIDDNEPLHFMDDGSHNFSDAEERLATNDDDQTLPLKQVTRKSEVRSKKENRPDTAIPRRIIKDLLKNATESKIPPDALDQIVEASDLYFDQVMSDLADYSAHAKRKTIDQSDVTQLMRRQRLLNDNGSAFTLAHRYLPAELLEKIDHNKTTK